MSPDWADTICSIEVMAPGLFSEGFLVDPFGCLPLVLHGLLWDFTNIQATQGGSFMIFLVLLVIIPLFGSIMRDSKEQWFIMW